MAVSHCTSSRSWGLLDVCRPLLTEGKVDANLAQRNGCSPLDIASYEDHLVVCRLLLTEAKQTSTGGGTMLAPLSIASQGRTMLYALQQGPPCCECHARNVGLLLRRGAREQLPHIAGMTGTKHGGIVTDYATAAYLAWKQCGTCDTLADMKPDMQWVPHCIILLAGQGTGGRTKPTVWHQRS